MEPMQKWLFFCATIAIWIVNVTGQAYVLIPFNVSLPVNGDIGYASLDTPLGQLLGMQVVITYYKPASYSNMFMTDVAVGLDSDNCGVSFGGTNRTLYLPNRKFSSFPGLSDQVTNGAIYTSRVWVPPSPFAIASRTNVTFRMAYIATARCWLNGTANISINTADTSGTCAYPLTQFAVSPSPSPSPSPSASPSPSFSSPSPSASPSPQLVPLANETAMAEVLASVGVTLGQDPALVQPTNNITHIFTEGTFAYGLYYAADVIFLSAVSTPSGSITIYDYGAGTVRMVVVVGPMGQTGRLLGTALQTPIGFAVATNMAFMSITRYDAQGNVLSDLPMTFEIQAGFSNAVFYRYPSGSASGTLVSSAGGSVGPCLSPAPTCYRITSRTSSFVGLAPQSSN
eukprot:EG_transcript_15235